MTCPDCGALLPDNAEFCSNCGCRLSPPASVLPNASATPAPPPTQPNPPRPSAPLDINTVQGTKFFLFARPFFNAIDNGTFFKKPFVWLYILFAVLNLLYPLYFLFQMIDKSLFDYLGFSAVLLWLLAAFAGWVGFQLWWNRKDKINRYLTGSEEFVATPTYTHWFQTAGEYVGTMVAIYGFGISLISFVFSGGRGADLPFNSFSGMGVAGIFLAPVAGFFIIVVTRMLAEWWRSLASIANNTKRIADQSGH